MRGLLRRGVRVKVNVGRLLFRLRARTSWWTWPMRRRPAAAPERETTIEDVRLAVARCERAPTGDVLNGTPGGGYGLELYLMYAERVRDRLPTAELRAEAEALIAPQRRRLK